MMNFIPPTLQFFLVLFFSMCQADEELLCCQGWSDEVGKMMVSKNTATAYCRAKQECEDSKCAVKYGALFNQREDQTKSGNADATTTADKDCFKWKPDQDHQNCLCQTNWCNCPDDLRNQQPKPKPKELKCCKKDRNENQWEMTEETCVETLPQPLGCIVYGYFRSFYVRCGLGDRFPGNCTTFLQAEENHLQGTCYCQTDLCNCPQIPPKTTPTTKTTTTPSSFQLKNHYAETRLIFSSFFLANKWMFN